MDSLRDSTVVVTGGGTGIGRATARAFAEEGADVLVVGRTADRLAGTAAGRPAIRTLVADVTAPGAAERIVAAATACAGRLDVLVNNAAVVRDAPLGAVEPAAVTDLLATNLLAPVQLTQAALPHLGAGSTVLNVTTAIGQRGWPLPGGTLYAALKAALDALTRSWAVQLAPRGIRVNAVAPGPVATPIAAHRGLDPAQAEALAAQLAAHVPLGRIGRPEEIAYWLVALARPEAGYATGVVLPVDGGALVG
jgi:meso-butanediol dehydrogenase / (S,S)-butanediol dehydrogenase / diacetyl reductase